LKLVGILQVVPELAVPDASSGGSFVVKFRSDQGFNFTSAGPKPDAKLESADIGQGTGETISAGWGPVGMGVGVEFPRIELSVFDMGTAFITLKTYSTSYFTPGTTLTNDVPPCQMGTTTFLGAAGYKLEFLGFKAADGTVELFKQDYVKYLHDEKCD
jgi:hypothetical protein